MAARIQRPASDILASSGLVCLGTTSLIYRETRPQPPIKDFSARLSTSRQPRRHRPLPGLDPDGHLHLPEWILHDEIRIPVIDTLDDNVGVRHRRIREQQKLRPRERLEHR